MTGFPSTMSALAPTLGGLDEDIVLRILSSSDISTTISVSRINRHLHHITSAKQLWLLHVQDLVDRSLIELPPSVTLLSLSTADLIDLVRRLVTGPATWAAGQSPQVSTEISIRMMHDQPAGFLGRSRVKLLDGGRHILFSCETLLELWDVATQQLVWSREPIFPQILNFSATPGAHSVVLAALPADNTGLAIGLEIHEIDTFTGESAVHLTLPIVARDCSTDPIIRRSSRGLARPAVHAP
ncbi:hypothetical protein FB451DRAFT_775914 [Mycena latifolia]|nr:hypothetical protein FB451DRAFT_775914 [Mycena latifolia]